MYFPFTVLLTTFPYNICLTMTIPTTETTHHTLCVHSINRRHLPPSQPIHQICLVHHRKSIFHDINWPTNSRPTLSHLTKTISQPANNTFYHPQPYSCRSSFTPHLPPITPLPNHVLTKQQQVELRIHLEAKRIDTLLTWTLSFFRHTELLLPWTNSYWDRCFPAPVCDLVEDEENCWAFMR
jgi:hypothetical protein